MRRTPLIILRNLSKALREAGSNGMRSESSRNVKPAGLVATIPLLAPTIPRIVPRVFRDKTFITITGLSIAEVL